MSRNTRRGTRVIDEGMIAVIWEGTAAGGDHLQLRGACGMIGTLIDVGAEVGEMAMTEGGVEDTEGMAADEAEVTFTRIVQGARRRLMRCP